MVLTTSMADASQGSKSGYVKKMVDEMYPQAECVTLVCDQQNTHTIAALSEALTPDEARRLAQAGGRSHA